MFVGCECRFKCCDDDDNDDNDNNQRHHHNNNNNKLSEQLRIDEKLAEQLSKNLNASNSLNTTIKKKSPTILNYLNHEQNRISKLKKPARRRVIENRQLQSSSSSASSAQRNAPKNQILLFTLNEEEQKKGISQHINVRASSLDEESDDEVQVLAHIGNKGTTLKIIEEPSMKLPTSENRKHKEEKKTEQVQQRENPKQQLKLPSTSSSSLSVQKHQDKVFLFSLDQEEQKKGIAQHIDISAPSIDEYSGDEVQFVAHLGNQGTQLEIKEGIESCIGMKKKKSVDPSGFNTVDEQRIGETSHGKCSSEADTTLGQSERTKAATIDLFSCDD